MKQLSANWITESHIDFEYKRYLLLAYLKEISEDFDQTKLYPALSDLYTHYKNIILLKENKKNLFDSFPEKMREADLRHFKVVYEKIIRDDSLMQELEDILNFSIPQFEYFIAEGKKIYDFIEEQLQISPVGILPLNPGEGYLLLKDGAGVDIKAYEYQITIFDNPDDRYRGIHTQYLSSFRWTLSNTLESIKSELIRVYKKIPNPAAYVIETDMVLPVEETFLPLAKRTLLKYVSDNTLEKR